MVETGRQFRFLAVHWLREAGFRTTVVAVVDDDGVDVDAGVADDGDDADDEGFDAAAAPPRASSPVA